MTDAILIEKLSKSYQLGAINTGSFRGDIQRWWARVRRAPDPLLKVGEVDHGNRQGETIWALKNINLEIKQGETLGIIGRNGAGKSTLLKILSRVTAPTTGEVKIKGRIASLLEVGTGFHPELTGRENIFLNGAIMGMNRDEVKQKFDEIVNFSGVETFLDTPIKRYSSGMYVRLAFAVAAHLDPDILVVDEVLSVGDIEFQKKSLGKMSDATKEGRTVLFVSHNLGAINRLCRKSILLEKGKLVCFDKTENVIKTYVDTGNIDLTEFRSPHNALKDITLRVVRLCNRQGIRLQKPEIRYDEEFIIEIEYEVNSKTTNCTVWIALETSEGIMVFTSADYDKNEKMLGTRNIGYYKASVIIPSHLLNFGRYVIIGGIVSNSPVVIYNREETITFSILEVNSPSAILDGGTRRGVIQPVLEWTTRRIMNVADLGYGQSRK
jgi:lipopolysaccharide transport system ATP-binding protein